MFQGGKIKKLFADFMLGFCIVLAGCAQEPNKYTDVVDVQNPFGLSWNSLAKKSKAAEDECLSEIAGIDIFLNPAEEKLVLKACVSEHYDTIFLPKIEIIELLQKGEVNVLMKGDNEPVMYTYSYLHELHPTDETRERKRLHAAEFRTALNELYGAPTARGNFDQGSSLGFVVRDKGEKPCDFWVVQDVGVFLCTERVILVDGFEMSLSFVELEASTFGEGLRNMILSHGTQYREKTSAQLAPEPLTDTMSVREAVDILTRWHHDSCTSENLEPLETVWSISPEYEKRLNSVFVNFTGDALAEYAFNFPDNHPDEWPKKSLNNIIMHLLKRAADQGSAMAMNEIGASLFYCFQGVERDEERALLWIDKAIIGEDALAVQTRAHMYLTSDADVLESREEAIKLLKKCDKLDENVCSKELAAFQRIVSLKAK